MSYSTVYGLWPGTEKRVNLAKFRNSRGMAPVVWNAMAQRYLGAKPYAWSSLSDEIWPLAERTDIPRGDRAVLRMTFDTRYILAADVPLAIDDIAIFLHSYRDVIDLAAANHWPRYADLLVTQWQDKPEAFGVHQTSVSRNTWEGPFNEETRAYEPFDWSTASSVYDGLHRVVAPPSGTGETK